MAEELRYLFARRGDYKARTLALCHMSALTATCLDA